MGDWGLPRRPEQIALDPKRVIVAPFTNNTGDPSLTTLGDMTADQLASGITEIQLVQVVDAPGVQAAEAGAASAAGSGGARMLAQGLGAGTVLWGSYYRRGDSLEFEAQLTDTRSGQILVPIQSAAGPAADPSTAIERLRGHAMAALAWHFDPKIEEVQNSNRPSNYEAYREFIAGDDVRQPDINCRFAECGYEHWRRAYALDTTFTLPLILIARRGTTSVGANSRIRSPRPCVSGMIDYRDMTGPRSTRRSPGAMANAACNWTPLERRQKPLAGLRVMPCTSAPGFGGLVTSAKRSPPSIGSTRPSLIMAWPCRITSSGSTKRNSRRPTPPSGRPDNLGYLAMQAFAYVGLGRLEKVEEVLQAMLKVPANVETWGLIQAWAFTWVAARPRGPRAFRRGPGPARAGSRRVSVAPPEEQDRHENAYAVVLYGAGHWVEARTVVQHLIATAAAGDDGDPDIWERGAQSYLGGIAAHLGDQREMDRVDRWLASRKGSYLSGVPTFDRARMAAIRGDRERAVTLIRLAVDQGYPMFLRNFGPHLDPDFKTLWGYPPFEELRRPKESSEGP